MSTLAEALATLPEEPADIAAYLEQRGIKGKRGVACECPVARYILAETGAPVSVAPYYVYTMPHGAVAPTTFGVSQFIRVFDLGGYPALVQA